MTHHPRIGIHCPGTGTGGPWRYVHSLLKHIDANEFDVSVICDIDGEYAPRPEIGVVNMSEAVGRARPAVSADYGQGAHGGPSPPYHILRSLIPPQARMMLGFHRNAKRLAARLQPLKLDLFHTQNTGCEEAPYAAKLAGIPHIVGTFHTDWTYDLHHERAGPGYRLLESISNRSLNMAIAVSDATGRNWQRRTAMPAGRILTIHNGIDVDRFRRKQPRQEARTGLNLPADAFVVVGVGRLDEAKGFADLLAAVAITIKSVPNLHVVIAGDGPLRKSLEYRAFELGIAGNVHFTGFVPDVQSVLDAADVFAIPSLCETFGYALVEAMAAELPALGSNVGGIPEVIAHNETGFVLPPQSPQGWATALTLLEARPDLRDRFGTAGRQRVKDRFTETSMAQRTFDVYRRLLTEGR